MTIKQHNIVYAGEQVQAAGCLIYAADTGNYLLGYRAPEVLDGNSWCGFGGKIEKGEPEEVAARREIAEEIGYEGPMDNKLLYVYESPVLRFTNYLSIVPRQFFPKLNWESAGYVWAKRENFPHLRHYGLVALLEDEKASELLSITESQHGF